MTANTTTARAYARTTAALERHRAAALEYVNLGKLHRAADELRRTLDTDTRVIAANLAALDSLSRCRAGLTEQEHAVAAGIAAQGALDAIRSSTRREVKAMTIAELAALLEDAALTPMEQDVAVNNLHDRYAEKIGDAAYGKQLDAWIGNGTPDSDTRAMMFAALTAD